MGPYTGADVDGSRIATVLRDLADDIEEQGVHIQRAVDYADAEPTEAVEFGIGLKFIARRGSKTLGNLAQQFEESDEAKVIR